MGIAKYIRIIKGTDVEELESEVTDFVNEKSKYMLSLGWDLDIHKIEIRPVEFDKCYIATIEFEEVERIERKFKDFL